VTPNLLEVLVVLDMLCGPNQDKAGAMRAVIAGRKVFAVDACHLMLLCMSCIVDDAVDAGLFNFVSGLKFGHFVLALFLGEKNIGCKAQEFFRVLIAVPSVPQQEQRSLRVGELMKRGIDVRLFRGNFRGSCRVTQRQCPSPEPEAPSDSQFRRVCQWDDCTERGDRNMGHKKFTKSEQSCHLRCSSAKKSRGCACRNLQMNASLDLLDSGNEIGQFS
jgi:hypothetical protein